MANSNGDKAPIDHLLSSIEVAGTGIGLHLIEFGQRSQMGISKHLRLLPRLHTVYKLTASSIDEDNIYIVHWTRRSLAGAYTEHSLRCSSVFGTARYVVIHKKRTDTNPATNPLTSIVYYLQGMLE